MKLLKFNILLLFVLLSSNLNSQNISGRIISSKDINPIPFASIAIEGTTLGTVTNFKGFFEFEIPQKYNNGTLLISCIGYEENKIKIRNLQSKKNLNFILKPSSVDIDEVVVTEKSLFPYTIIKKAIKNIQTNFINKAYNYEFYYSNREITPANKTLKRESIILLSDKSGYKERSVYNTFKSINYKFIQSKRNFEVKYISDGNTNIDDLLEFDIARHTRNILDLNRVSEFDIIIKEETIYNGDSIWILSYKNNKTRFSSTGDFHVNSYSGEIYIKKGTFAVLYNKTRVITNNHSDISRNLYSSKKNNPDLKKISYFFEVFYKKEQELYILDKINYEINYSYKKNKLNKNTKSKLVVLKFITENPQLLESRTYYENIQEDKEFWKKFKL